MSKGIGPFWAIIIIFINCCIGINPYIDSEYYCWFSLVIKNKSSYNVDLFFNDIHIYNLESNTIIEYIITHKRYDNKYNVEFNVYKGKKIKTQFPETAPKSVSKEKCVDKKNIMYLSYFINGKISTIRIPLYPEYEDKKEVNKNEKYLKVKGVANDSSMSVFTGTIVLPPLNYPYPEQFDTLILDDSSFNKP